MFEKKDKRRIYWLIDQYLSGKITEKVFCDEFYYSYDLEISYNDLTELEQQVFSDLGKIASRFSEHKEDHQLDTNAFSTVEDLKQKIIETKETLKDN